MSPFAARLRELLQQAEHDPHAAWQRIATLGPSLEQAEEVIQLAGVVLAVGGDRLRRDNEAVTVLRQLQALPLTAISPEVQRSLWRAEGVLTRCAGHDDSACRATGIATPSEACRYAGTLAQSLAMRGRMEEAAAAARDAALIARDLPTDDPVVTQTGHISLVLLHAGQQYATLAAELAEAAAAASAASEGRSDEWQRRHASLFVQARAKLIACKPGEALRALHPLLDLEDQAQAPIAQRFHAAALACRAYAARGDQAQAERTLEACRDFSTRAGDQRLLGEFALLEKAVRPR